MKNKFFGLEVLSICLVFLTLGGCSTFELYKNRSLIEEITMNRETVNASRIGELILKGENPNESYGGAGALLYAMWNVTQRNRFAVVEALLKGGADINHSGRYVIDDFLVGDESASSIRLKQLFHPAVGVSEGPLINHVIAYARYEIDESELQKWKDLLVKYKFNANQVDSKRNSPLHFAVNESIKNDRLNAMIPFLVKQGSRCNYKNADGVSSSEIIKTKANPALLKSYMQYCQT